VFSSEVNSDVFSLEVFLVFEVYVGGVNIEMLAD